jgi:carbamoyl-phosphate synthase large subunit
MIGKSPRLARLSEDDLPHVGVKAALFSFTRLGDVDPVLGVEMASTGEVGCIAEDFESAYLLAMESSKVYRPKKGILVSAGPEFEKLKIFLF